MITNQLLKFPIIDGDSSKSESAKLKLRVQNEKGNYHTAAAASTDGQNG